jgi:uncharacterized protein YabN with tetrapyrrole methylase and pyrophosphatase domain
LTPFETQEVEVCRWAKKKGIFDESDAITQMGKMREEVSELDVEVIFEEAIGLNREAIKSELGDVLVTCIIQARFHGLNAQTCLESALNKITKRTGKMIDGQFVKDSH